MARIKQDTALKRTRRLLGGSRKLDSDSTGGTYGSTGQHARRVGDQAGRKCNAGKTYNAVSLKRAQAFHNGGGHQCRFQVSGAGSLDQGCLGLNVHLAGGKERQKEGVHGAPNPNQCTAHPAKGLAVAGCGS